MINRKYELIAQNVDREREREQEDGEKVNLV